MRKKYPPPPVVWVVSWTAALIAIFVGLPQLAEAAPFEGVCQMPGASGVVVRWNQAEGFRYVLTAGHVTTSRRVVMTTSSGRSLSGTTVYRPRGEGAVVIMLDVPAASGCDIAVNPPTAGARVCSQGFPNGRLSNSCGKFVTTTTGQLMRNGQPVGGPAEQYETTLTVGPGWSGGPVWNSSGQLVGLVSNGEGTPSTGVVGLGEIKRCVARYLELRKGGPVASGSPCGPAGCVAPAPVLFPIPDPRFANCPPIARPELVVDYEKLAAIILVQIAEDPRFQGRAGSTGKAGNTGPQGPPGVAGPTGPRGQPAAPTASADRARLDELEKMVNAIKTVDVVVMSNGKIIDSETYDITAEPIVINSIKTTPKP